ncbi:MAG: hypothetical protein DMF77_10515 [Acidobacteria bacterium]|nr:MAG: hypothetical protein DMF77_10515 [Acidobacteriota bacterium]
MKASLRRAGLVTIALAAGATAGRPAPSPSPAAARDLSHVTPEERAAYVRRAMVWQPTRVASKDLLVGPQGDGAFKFDESVACDYITPLAPHTGTTPKFDCALKPDDVVKVKYGRKNGEVYAEVAATRLFWALGFGADRMYPVQVTCRNCPIEPWYWSTEKRVPEKTFEIASIERRLPGKLIETRDDEGWKWPELDTVDEKAGGAPRAHRDALKLLMVLIQNSDTKPSNQRILCPPDAVKTAAAGNETCERPLLYVQDLGYAFGEATLFDTNKNNLESWKGEPIWKDPAHCVGNLKKSLPGTLKADPPISEAGRKFLADLLVQLSDKQITDMFTAARVERFHVHPERNLPVSDWVAAFKKKRDEIVSAHCPS